MLAEVSSTYRMTGPRRRGELTGTFLHNPAQSRTRSTVRRAGSRGPPRGWGTSLGATRRATTRGTMDASANAGQLSRKVDRSDGLDQLVRVGLISYGVVHLLIALLALRLAVGSSSGKAYATGALAHIPQTSARLVSLFIGALGFVALVVWQGIEAAI